MPCLSTYVALLSISLSFALESSTGISLLAFLVTTFERSLSTTLTFVLSFGLPFAVSLVLALALASTFSFSLVLDPVDFHGDWSITARA